MLIDAQRPPSPRRYPHHMLTHSMLNRTIITAGTAAAVLALASCGTSESADPAQEATATATETTKIADSAAPTETVRETVTATQDAAPPAQPPAPQQSLRDTYADAIANPARFFPESQPGHDGTFQYALLDVDGDAVPELLVREGGTGERRIAIALATGEQAASTLADGDGTLLFSNGMYPGLEEYRFGETTATITQYELRGGRVEQVSGPTDTIVGNPLDEFNVIHWLPTTDPSALNTLDTLANTDPLAQPLAGNFRQYSIERDWRGDSFNVEITYPNVTYPELGCRGTLEPTPPGHASQAGFIEHITEGTCDDGGTWHLLLSAASLQAGTPAIYKARYVAPDGRYVADGGFR